MGTRRPEEIYLPGRFTNAPTSLGASPRGRYFISDVSWTSKKTFFKRDINVLIVSIQMENILFLFEYFFLLFIFFY